MIIVCREASDNQPLHAGYAPPLFALQFVCMVCGARDGGAESRCKATLNCIEVVDVLCPCFHVSARTFSFLQLGR